MRGFELGMTGVAPQAEHWKTGMGHTRNPRRLQTSTAELRSFIPVSYMAIVSNDGSRPSDSTSYYIDRLNLNSENF